MKNEFTKRKGKVRFSRELLIDDADEKILAAIFKNFYPVTAEFEHTLSFTDAIVMFGYSPHFRILQEGEVMPEYNMSLGKNEEGEFIIEKIEEIKKMY